MILDTPLKSITAVLSGAKNTTDAAFTATYEDVDNKGTVNSRGTSVGNTNGVTAVTLVAAPTSVSPTGTASSSQVSLARRVRLLTIYNADAAAITVTVRLTVSSTNSTQAIFTLQVGDSLQYSYDGGFKVLSSSGATKTTETAGSANQLKQVLTIPVGTLVLIADTNTFRVAVPFAFTVLSARFVTDKPATTGSKLTTLTLSTTAGAVTGGVMALTSANCTPTGNAVAATAISGANATGTAGQEIIITASSTTAFVEGTGHVEVVVSNNA